MAWLAVNRYFKPQVVISNALRRVTRVVERGDIRAVVGDDARVKFMKPARRESSSLEMPRVVKSAVKRGTLTFSQTNRKLRV